MEDDSATRPPRRKPGKAATIIGATVIGAFAAVSVAIAGATLATRSDQAVAAPLTPEQAASAARAALDTVAPALPAGMPTEKPSVLGKPLDPPSLEEFGYARRLAHAAETPGARRVDDSTGYEFLSLDIADDQRAGQRVLEVQSYDYATSQLVSQHVDLVAGTVSETRAAGARPSPSAREGLFAMDLLIRSDVASQVRSKFHELTGQELTSAAQLDYVPASNIPALALRSVPDCAVDRCITFQGRSLDGVWLYLNQIVVDLTTKTVHPLT